MLGFFHLNYNKLTIFHLYTLWNDFAHHLCITYHALYPGVFHNSVLLLKFTAKKRLNVCISCQCVWKFFKLIALCETSTFCWYLVGRTVGGKKLKATCSRLFLCTIVQNLLRELSAYRHNHCNMCLITVSLPETPALSSFWSLHEVQFIRKPHPGKNLDWMCFDHV